MKRISRRVRQHTITLFNYVDANDGEADYQRTVLKAAYLETGCSQSLSRQGAAEEETARLIIDLRDLTVTDGREYIPFYKWEQLSDKSGYFTFSVLNDFFVSGEISEADSTKQALLSKYQAFSVTGVSAVHSQNGEPVILEVTAK